MICTCAVNGDVNANVDVDVGVHNICNEDQETEPGEEGGRWERVSMDGVREKE